MDFGSRTASAMGARVRGSKGDPLWLGHLVKADVPEWEYDPWPAHVQNYVKTSVAQKVVGVCDSTRADIQRIVGDGLANGRSIDEVALDLRGLYAGFSAHRSWRIARTETVAASNYGSHQAALESGWANLKIWSTAKDERVRSLHRALEGERQPLEEPFSNGLQFPGDPAGSAKQVIHCRCAVLYDYDPELEPAVVEPPQAETAEAVSASLAEGTVEFVPGVPPVWAGTSGVHIGGVVFEEVGESEVEALIEKLKPDRKFKTFEATPKKVSGVVLTVVEADGRVWTSRRISAEGSEQATFTQEHFLPGGRRSKPVWHAMHRLYDQTGIVGEVVGHVGDFDAGGGDVTRHMLVRRVAGAPWAAKWPLGKQDPRIVLASLDETVAAVTATRGGFDRDATRLSAYLAEVEKLPGKDLHAKLAAYAKLEPTRALPKELVDELFKPELVKDKKVLDAILEARKQDFGKEHEAPIQLGKIIRDRAEKAFLAAQEAADDRVLNRVRTTSEALVEDRKEAARLAKAQEKAFKAWGKAKADGKSDAVLARLQTDWEAAAKERVLFSPSVSHAELQAHAQEMAKHVRAELAKVREMGTYSYLGKGDVSPKWERVHGASSVTPLGAVSEIADNYPTGWWKRSLEKGPLSYEQKLGARAYYSGRGIGKVTEAHIRMGGRDSSVFGHEFGHRMQASVGQIDGAETSWLAARTGGTTGAVRLKKLLGGGYDADEWCRPDNFDDAYIGKDYALEAAETYGSIPSVERDALPPDHPFLRPGYIRTTPATEVLTMGYQKLYHGDHYGWLDQEHIDLTIGMMAAF